MKCTDSIPLLNNEATDMHHGISNIKPSDDEQVM